MAYQRGGAKKKPVQGGNKFEFVNVGLDDVMNLIADTIDAGKTIHINVVGASLRFSDGETTYSMLLKDRGIGEKSGKPELYGTLNAEKANAESEYTAFQKVVQS